MMHGSRQFRSTSTSPIFPVNSQEGPVTSSGMIHRSRSLNLCPALTTDNDGPTTTDRSQRPGSAAASPRTQSPALLHIVGLEIGRDGKFALMSTSSICDADRQPTPLPNVTGAQHKERVSRRRSDSGAVETAGSSPSSSLIGGRATGAWCPGSNMRLRFPAAASNANLYSGLQRSHTAFCS